MLSPWTNVYGLARTILAAGTALTLASNRSDVLFANGARGCFGESDLATSPIYFMSMFCLPMDVEVARWLAVGLLLLVASGWMPCATGVLHWWIAASFMISSVVPDGGDHLTGTLTLILIPMTVTDRRRWHWQAPPEERPTHAWQARVLLAFSVLVVLRIQMAGVYLHAFTGKTGVEEWVDGTAAYYWFMDHNFGPPGMLQAALRPVLENAVSVVALTWGSLLVEILLVLGIAASQRVRLWLFWMGLTFHGLIAVVIGLWSFSTAATAGLLLYLWPVDRVFDVGRLMRKSERRCRWSTGLKAWRWLLGAGRV